MVIVSVNEKEFYMDGYTKKNMDFVKPLLPKRNETHIGIIDGRVGTGKSTLVDQLAYYCSDGNFTLDDKAFTVRGFSKILENAKKGQSNNNIVLDEAFELNRRRTNSMANMKILKQLQRIRSKNLWIWIVLPCVYDLDKNIILNLANIFIHTYTDYDFGQKGKYAVYNRHGLKRLWLYCRDSLSYYQKVSKPAYRARFTGKFLSSDYNVYERRKNKELDEFDKEEEPKIPKYQRQRNEIICALSKMGFSGKKISELSSMPPTTIYDVLRPGRQPQNTVDPV